MNKSIGIKKVNRCSIDIVCCLAFSGLKGYRGELSLSPSDAQHSFEPERSNISLTSLNNT
eukprot:564010-Heterocapsa_arctica.AAC.1